MKRKVTLLILGIVLVISGTLFYLVRDTGEIYSNVSVSGIDLSNKTKGEALKVLTIIKLPNKLKIYKVHVLYCTTRPVIGFRGFI